MPYGKMQAQLKRVAYDVEREVGRLRESGLPEEMAAMRRHWRAG
jgi:hypothetical protein